MTFWKGQNYGVSKRLSGCQSLRGEGWIQGTQRILGGQWDYSIWSMSLYIFFQTHRRSTPGVNPNKSYGLWVAMMPPNVGSSVVANTSLCWWMLRAGEAVNGGGEGISVPSPQFGCEPRTARKHSLFQKPPNLPVLKPGSQMSSLPLPSPFWPHQYSRLVNSTIRLFPQPPASHTTLVYSTAMTLPPLSLTFWKVKVIVLKHAPYHYISLMLG